MTVIPRDFKERQKYYDETYLQLPYSWKKCYNYIISVLKLLHFSKCKTIVEFGSNDGALAVNCLRELRPEYQWTGYDFLPRCISQSRWHPRYKPVLLEKPLWETEMPKFDVFVSSHTIEHLYSDEVQKLASWLSEHTKFMVVCIPLGLKASRVRIKSGHILDKGSLWFRDVFEAVGFDVIWETGGYFGWYVHNDFSYNPRKKRVSPVDLDDLQFRK